MTPKRTKEQAQKLLEIHTDGPNGLILNFLFKDEMDTCTGDLYTCKNYECPICALMWCPHAEPLHFHHDGCPACWFDELKDMKGN